MMPLRSPSNTGPQASYQSLLHIHEDIETPQDDVMMIHVVPESGKSRWNHIEDLDSFFTRVYHYHQRHGCKCMTAQELFELFQYIYVLFFSIFLMQCVDYSVLFKDSTNSTTSHGKKVMLTDAVIPISKCAANFSTTLILCIIIALAFWVLRVIKVVYNIFQYQEIRVFYTTALKISSSDLDNMTWHEVQQRLLEVQSEQQMCIHKTELTELDIYHRILRYKNYVISMINKDLLPLKYNLPFIGEVVFLSKGLKYNLEMILFWGPISPFKNTWHLKEDYKKASKRKELARELSRNILIVGIANFILCPLILLWQILYSFFSYAEVIKREPSFLGARRWSQYGKLYIRHFNELDHELYARLNRGYKAASEYLSIFSSHFLAILAKNIAFVSGALFGVLLGLTIYDEDVITVEHVLTTMTVLGMITAACRMFIPDEHLVFCPEKYMTNILAHIHYIPDHWKGSAHTYKARNEFAQLFQYKAVYLFEELMSPIITPIILCFFLRHRALDIVDFFRNFTVEVVGVGDVCSFAQMDIRKHGNPQWMTEGQTEANQYQQAEHGKTELSLVHFTLTNPKWNPPQSSSVFLNNLKEQVQADAERLHTVQEENPLYYSLYSLHSLGAGYADLVNSILRIGPDRPLAGSNLFTSNLRTSHQVESPPTDAVRGGLSRAEGPLYASQAGLLTSIHPGQLSVEEMQSSVMLGPQQALPIEYTAANMSLSTLYMHQLHSRYIQQRSSRGSPSVIWQRPPTEMPGILETSPDKGEGDTGEQRPLLFDTRIVRSS